MKTDKPVRRKGRFPRIHPYALALITGAAITPLAVLLSLQFIPFLSAAVLYAVLGFSFGVSWPKPSWQWGIWVTLGTPIALLLVIVVISLVQPSPMQTAMSLLSSSFVWITALFGYLPGILGGCVGGYAGAQFVRRRRAQEGAKKNGQG